MNRGTGRRAPILPCGFKEHARTLFGICGPLRLRSITAIFQRYPMDRQDDPDATAPDAARRQALVASFGSRALEDPRYPRSICSAAAISLIEAYRPSSSPRLYRDA